MAQHEKVAAFWDNAGNDTDSHGRQSGVCHCRAAFVKRRHWCEADVCPWTTDVHLDYTNVDTYTYRYSHPYADANTHPHLHSQCDTNSYTNADTYGHPYVNADAYAYPYVNPNPHADTDVDDHCRTADTYPCDTE
jgi:Zn-finger nucleic acid-binding protein